MELTHQDSVAILSFPSRPRSPRLTRALLRELREALITVRESGVFDSVVIAANESSFAVGADLEEVAAPSGSSALEFAREGQAILGTIEHSPLRTVAAIRGFCLGGGFDLALACHARVAAYGSSFGHPGPTLGLLTGWGGTQRLSRLVGRAAALQILLTGERIPATQALTLGLVDALVSPCDLIDEAVRRARLEARNAKLEARPD